LFFVTDPDVAVFNDFITMKYTEEEFISQTIASSTDSNPNPSGITADNGRAVIYPPIISQVSEPGQILAWGVSRGNPNDRNLDASEQGGDGGTSY
jgi:hypothetical protein